MSLNNRPRPDKRRPRSAYVGQVLIAGLILLFTGCRPPTPTGPATATLAEPTAPQLPTTTPTIGDADGEGSKPVDEVTLPEPLTGLADRLTLTWFVEALSGDELVAITGGATVDTGTVVARYTSDSGDPGAPAFTILLTPRADLSLDAYLEEVAATLAATAGADAGGVTVNGANIDYSLRVDGIPVALIQFQADGRLFGAEGLNVEGMQAALFDETATNIVVITLTGDLARADQLQPLLTEIVAALTQPDMAE